MRVHVLQHVSFEGRAAIAAWARSRGHALITTRLFGGDALPDVGDFDRLVIMGGPMGACDESAYPWLADEKAVIREAIGAGRSVVGICLGAQLIADVLGARVYPSGLKEIGWFAVSLTRAGRDHPVSSILPEQLVAFHWHGDTFELPSGAVHLARNSACEHQAFLYEDRVVGLQFHSEATPESVREITAACARELAEAAGATFVQPAGRIVSAGAETYRRSKEAIFGVMDWLPK